MTQVVYGKLNPGLPWRSSLQQEEDCFYQETGLKIKEEASEMLHLEYDSVWCCNMCNSEIRS